MQNVFVYGTLQLPEIVEKLTGQKFKTYPAVLNGYKRYSVINNVYPAIIEQKGEKTEGFIFENVDNRSLGIITFYEGDEYIKKIIPVIVNGRRTNAVAFVWNRGIEQLESKKWDLADFRKTNLHYYLDVVIPEILELCNK